MIQAFVQEVFLACLACVILFFIAGLVYGAAEAILKELGRWL